MKPDTRSFYAAAVEKAARHVVEDLDRALDLEALARLAAMSPFHFHRVFRGMLGETPLELQRRLRLERAAWALAHGDAPVTHLAFAAGYETHEAFTRAFRAHYGRAPSELRQDAGARAARGERPLPIELAARSGLHFSSTGAASFAPHFTRGERTMDVQIKTMPELRIATVTHIGPYNRISEAFARLGALAGPAGLFGPGAAMLAVYTNDPETTPPSALRSEAAIVIAAEAKLPEGLGERRLAGGRYACTTHVGPYEQLGDTWARFMGEWLPGSGERMAAADAYEIYRNTPMDTPREKLVTELYLPLM